MEPPRKGDIARFAADGSLAERLEHARRIGNDRTSPSLLYKFGQRNGLLPLNSAPPPAWQGGLPSTGSPKVLVLLVDFAEYPRSTENTVSYVKRQMFGAGTAANKPYESLTNYYQRSSYGKLNIQGDVLGWYRAKYGRRYYSSLGDGAGQEALIKEVIEYYDSLGQDFSQYDSDGDGAIDALFIKWTGPDRGWSSFWWAYQTSYASPDLVVDGKHVGSYVWSWIANPGYDGSTRYQPQVDIHETGHLLGLPDLYDYDGNKRNRLGPDGGVGGLDMMDGNWGDHNAFSKAMLGWLTPQVVGMRGSSSIRTLAPSGSSPDAVLIMPGADGNNIFSEFFIAQYRKRGVGNDPLDYPADGLTIWHVDATLTRNGYDFRYDNSYTSRKLVKLMQADGRDQIERIGASADAGDFYKAPKSLTLTSTPNSAAYGNRETGVSIYNLSSPGDTLSARFEIAGSAATAAIAPVQ